MNIVIIDDEQVAIDVLQIMLTKIKTVPITLKGTFTNVGDALALFEQEQIDVVLLDIEMVDMHGLQVAKRLIAMQPLVQIIFVTAHMQFAVDAFEIEATDYLLKPVHEKRLIKALAKAQNKWEIANPAKAQEELSAFYVRTFGSFQLLDSKNQTVKWRTKKVKELFIYLWLQKQKPILNVMIIELLWPNIDPEKGAANLYTTIYQIRKLFKDQGIDNAIEFFNNHYQFNVAMQSDYDDLQKILNENNYNDSNIQQILNLYEGDFLETEEYDWAIAFRSDIKQQVLNVLEHYVAKKESTNTLLKLSCLQKLLLLDEYNEHYMFMLLRFLVEQNRKTECIQLYEEIKMKLEDDLKIPIPPNIKKIYEDYMKK